MAIHQQESQRRNNDKNFAARVVISITWERSSGRISFMVPGERHDGSGTSASVDPGLVLQDWLPAEIAELLRLPLFDESTYGRVRIHERTAQEYLAADWLASLRRKGLPRKQLDGLLFRRTPHVATPVLAPHLRATTAWLALDDVPTQRRLIEIAPDVLLGDGDPSGIPVDERPRILTAYVEQFRGRRRVLDSLAEISLRRFGCASLAEAINRSVPDTNLPQEVRRALLADEATRVLAFDALLWTRVRNGETAERTDLVRKLADQSPLLAQHLDRLAKVRERDDGFRGQHVRKMQAIDARRAQQLDQSRGALEAAIEEIRSGKDMGRRTAGSYHVLHPQKRRSAGSTHPHRFRVRATRGGSGTRNRLLARETGPRSGHARPPCGMAVVAAPAGEPTATEKVGGQARTRRDPGLPSAQRGRTHHG